jgi:hypothetical protein
MASQRATVRTSKEVFMHRSHALSALTVCLLALSSSANAQRSVSTLHVQIDNWVFVPTLYNAEVESFVALRTDNPEGQNITSMWFIRQANNTWTSWGWTEQNKSKTVGYVKTALQIPSSEDGDWPVTPIAVNPAELPLGTMVRGVFVDDPFADAVASATDPNEILDFLVTIGWSAARIDIWDYACEPDVVLNAWAVGVEGTELDIAANGGNTNALIATTFANTVSNPCGTGSCTRVVDGNQQVILVSEGDAGSILAQAIVPIAGGYQFLEAAPIAPGQIIVQGLITNTGTQSATLLLSDGALAQVPAGQQVAVVHTWSTCHSQCRRIDAVVDAPGGGYSSRPIYCIDAKCYCCCWQNLQPNPPTWLQTLQNCPCTVPTDQNGNLIVPDGSLWSPCAPDFHPGAVFCMRSDCDSIPDGAPGQQCCYDANGNLITVGPAAGTPDQVAPCGSIFGDIGTHLDEDVDPFRFCMDAGMVDCYLFHRPPNNGNNCACNPPNHVHCTTPPSAASCDCD